MISLMVKIIANTMPKVGNVDNSIMIFYYADFFESGTHDA